MNKIETKVTRHDWETHAVFFNDKKIGHIIKEYNRDGYQYTPARSLGASYVAISGNKEAFSFDEARTRLVSSHQEFLSAFEGVYA
jgi:hypothetical protein